MEYFEQKNGGTLYTMENVLNDSLSRIKSFLGKQGQKIGFNIGAVQSAQITWMFILHGRKTVRELDKASREAIIRQHRLLSELLKENENTEFGKKYDFAHIRTAEQFKENIPFTEYDDYEPYIRRMMNGETNILSRRSPVHFAVTSGSIGVPKYIPVSMDELKKLIKYSAEMAFGVADEYYRNTTGKGVPTGIGLNTIEMNVQKTNAGMGKGPISGTLMKIMGRYVPALLTMPWEIICPDGNTDMKYVNALLSLARRDLVFMDSVFMTGLVDLMDYIRDNYKMLCNDICHGTISEDVEISESMRKALASQLKPDKARAKELMREFREGFDDPIIPRIWPKMSWVGGIGTGGFYSYTKKMRKYCGKTIPFNNLCYAASECFMAVARHMGDESFVLIPDSGFYEFIPVREVGKSTKTYNINELEIGEDYEIIVTNLSGFYRYRLRDVVRVTGYYNETPLIRFVYRQNQLASIAGEKTNEETLRWAVEHFSLETGVGITDYSVYADTESSPGHYVLLIEPYSEVKKKDIPYLQMVMERTIAFANPSYGTMLKSGILGGLELVILQQQTYQLYREMMAMKGVSPNQIKPVHVIDTPFQKNFFFNLKENYDHEDIL